KEIHSTAWSGWSGGVPSWCASSCPASGWDGTHSLSSVRARMNDALSVSRGGWIRPLPLCLRRSGMLRAVAVAGLLLVFGGCGADAVQVELLTERPPAGEVRRVD